MVLGTQNDVYDADHASYVLGSVGEAEIKKAMQELMQQGVASKVVRDPKKTRPGRMLKISEAYAFAFASRDGDTPLIIDLSMTETLMPLVGPC